MENKTQKIFILISIICILGLGYWLISPFFINKKINEKLPVLETSNNDVDKTNEVIEIKTGSFSGFDKIHTGQGTAKIIQIGNKNYIRFEDNFQVNNGPDLYVGLGAKGVYIKGSELGELKGNIGSQNYELPDSIDISNIEEVWIWCKAFSVPFAKAVFK